VEISKGFKKSVERFQSQIITAGVHHYFSIFLF